MSPKAKDVLGTDGYIAPEAYLGAEGSTNKCCSAMPPGCDVPSFLGGSGDYSPASDIYSIGVAGHFEVCRV